MEQIQNLNKILLAEMPEYREQAAAFPKEGAAQRRLLRSLTNVRPPMPLNPEFLAAQDKLLSAEREEKGVIDADTLPITANHPRLALWQGDITRLKVDAILNAANSALLGCFCPCHGCIDNAIHSAAGLQLRGGCHQLMAVQGHEEPTGRAKLQPPRPVCPPHGCPIVQGGVTEQDRVELAACYRSCLELAATHELSSVAFCCISNGEFHFPNREAAEIAVKTVTDFLRHDISIKKVIFNVFKDIDAQIYRDLLGTNGTADTGA